MLKNLMKNPLIYWNMIGFSHIPENFDWLNEAELQQMQGFRFPKKRQDWLSGRWTAKSLLRNIFQTSQNIELKDLSIQNKPSGAPYALHNGKPLDGSISISHRGNYAVTAFSFDPSLSLGIDLELVEEKSQGFIEDYFTKAETYQIVHLSSDEQMLASSLLWSGREALVKAHQIGLRVDTRAFELKYAPANKKETWQPLEILIYPSEMGLVKLFWLPFDEYIITLAVKQKNQEIPISPDLFEQIIPD